MNEWVTVYETNDRRRCDELALVMEAIKIRWRIHRESALCLQVPEVSSERAREEIRAFLVENEGWPPPDNGPSVSFPYAAAGSIAFAVVVLFVFGLEGREIWGLDWRGSGRTSAKLIMQGEWWRTVTALTLHLDVVHLMGNVVFGMLFGFLVSRDLGVGLAWFTILLCGAGGNALNAVLQVSEHTSVGASTAIFGAIGTLASYGTCRRILYKETGFRRWAPFVIGWVFLGLLGAGGERTDVLAHLLGLLVGLVIGLVLGLVSPHLRAGRVYQWWMGFGALALIVYSWFRALT